MATAKKLRKLADKEGTNLSDDDILMLLDAAKELDAVYAAISIVNKKLKEMVGE